MSHNQTNISTAVTATAVKFQVMITKNQQKVEVLMKLEFNFNCSNNKSKVLSSHKISRFMMQDFFFWNFIFNILFGTPCSFVLNLEARY